MPSTSESPTPTEDDSFPTVQLAVLGMNAPNSRSLDYPNIRSGMSSSRADSFHLHRGIQLRLCARLETR